MILRPSVLDIKCLENKAMSSEISRSVEFMEATSPKRGSNNEYNSTSVEMAFAVLLLAPNAMAADMMASGNGGGEKLWTGGREELFKVDSSSELLPSICANAGVDVPELYLLSRGGGSKE